jgi:threonine dehydrogenase-like Zn-dependent dehydrogenase
LVIGHEGFGVVEEVGPNVHELNPGDYVVATVRRPGHSIYDLIGTVILRRTHFRSGQVPPQAASNFRAYA